MTTIRYMACAALAWITVLYLIIHTWQPTPQFISFNERFNQVEIDAMTARLKLQSPRLIIKQIPIERLPESGSHSKLLPRYPLKFLGVIT